MQDNHISLQVSHSDSFQATDNGYKPSERQQLDSFETTRPLEWGDQGISVAPFEYNLALLDWLDPSEFHIPDTFDLNVFNQSFDPTSDRLTAQRRVDDTQQQNDIAQPYYSTNIHGRNAENPGEKSFSDVSAQWFSHIEPPLSTFDDPDVAEKPSLFERDVDDHYRKVVQRQLRGIPTNDAVPSTAFLNRCIRLFIEKFSNLLPIIHLPTFRPTESNAWLLFAMCTVGSQLVGTSEAASHGQRMFDSLNRAVLTSWSTLFNNKRDSLTILQAVVIGQAFAMMSAKPSHLLTAQAFHGTLIFGYQRVAKTLNKLNPPGEENLSPASEKANYEMARQVLSRIGDALRIQDAELALLCHQAPLMRTCARDRTQAQTDKGFCVPDLQSTRVLQSLVRGELHTSVGINSTSADFDLNRNDGLNVSRPTLGEYAGLADILIAVAERRCCSANDDHFHDLEEKLVEWHKNSAAQLDLSCSGAVHLELLWHSGWFAILCDIDKLEVALGRDGTVHARAAEPAAREWTRSPRAQRAFVHAVAVQQGLSGITVSEVPAIHVPRCAYHAGLIFCGLAKFATSDTLISPSVRNELYQYTDIQIMLQIGQLSPLDWWLIDHKYNGSGKLDEQVRTTVSFLRRAGPWGISQNLAHTLEAVLND